jgi:hypothetical protein
VCDHEKGYPGRQQPRNQPPPRRTKFGDGTFLACVGVVLGVLLVVVLARELPEASFFLGKSKRQGDSEAQENY